MKEHFTSRTLLPNIFGKIYISNPKGNTQTKNSPKWGRNKTCEPWNILSLTVQITLKLRQARKSRASVPVENVHSDGKGLPRGAVHNPVWAHLWTESHTWMVLMLLEISSRYLWTEKPTLNLGQGLLFLSQPCFFSLCFFTPPLEGEKRASVYS